MILPSFVLPSRSGLVLKETGLDTLDACRDPNHWKNYPHQVEYRYNSRGFRDSEWCEDLESAVWCFGDSFTVGLGVPYTNIWPQILSQKTNRRSINISLDGASNNWIARKIQEMSQEIKPRTVIIHWSFAHRRELDSGDAALPKIVDRAWQKFYSAVKDPSWPDVQRLTDFDLLSLEIQAEILDVHCGDLNDLRMIQARHNYSCVLSDEARRLFNSNDLDLDAKNTIDCISRVHEYLPNSEIIHSFIPNFATPEETADVLHYVHCCHWSCIEPFDKLDLGRDGFHYDVITAEKFCQQLIKLI